MNGRLSAASRGKATARKISAMRATFSVNWPSPAIIAPSRYPERTEAKPTRISR